VRSDCNWLRRINHRNNIVIHNFKEFLCDVIVADGILERQIELVFRFKHIVAFGIRVRMRVVARTT
jgi:hypothetical protein